MAHYIAKFIEYIKWVPDVLFILIILVCAWRGYKNGIIRGICGILAIIVSLYGANLIATAYSDEFTGMAKPRPSMPADWYLAVTMPSTRPWAS